MEERERRGRESFDKINKRRMEGMDSGLKRKVRELEEREGVNEARARGMQRERDRTL